MCVMRATGSEATWTPTERCPSCASPLGPQARFCAQCGTQVADLSGEAQRRFLTVAFFDLVGSTPIAETMDPEEFRDLVLAYQDACVAAIEGAHGYVADYRGDGIFAYFGYPAAQEDDGVRAVRAALVALDRVRATGPDLQVRVGIHTGLVVVGEMGSGTRRKHDVVMGDAPNVAARLQATAEPSSIVISDDTIRTLGNLFVTEDLGTPELKGITRPIRLYRVIGPADSAPAPVAPAPLIGRGAELAVLCSLFEQAADGEGRIVVIDGEPGVGKSRLVRALADGLADTDHEWIELVATPSDNFSPLRAVVELIRARGVAGLDDDDRQLLLALAGLEARDLGMHPAVQRRRTMTALVRWFLSFADRVPLVLFVEDLHWLDPTTGELLAALDDDAHGHALFLVATTREGEPEWTGRTPCTHLRLDPLAEQSALELARSIAADRLGEDVISDVVARAEGVPLFVEEVTRSVIEGGTTVIPTSLQQSITARLDRLGVARETAQVASVVGRDFDHHLLASVMERDETSVEAQMRVLLDSGLVEHAGAGRFHFRHALVRDVAYESLLRSRRRELHGKVAAAFITLLPDLVASQPEVVALHYSEAGDLRAAIDYWTRAAQAAGGRQGLAEGVQHATRAIESVRLLDASGERDQWEMSMILLLMRLIVQSSGSGDPRMEEIFRRAIELTEPAGEDAVERFSAISGLCAFFIGHGRFPEALAVAEEMAAAAERTGRRTFRLYASEWLGVAEYYRGNFERALQHLRDALAVYRPDRDLAAAELYGFEMRTSALFHIAYLQWYLGDPDESLRTMAQAREHGESLPFGFPLCHALVASGILHALRGEADEAAEYGVRAHMMATDNEWTIMAGQAAFARARAAWLHGNAATAITLLEDALEELLAPGGFGSSTLGLTWLAEAQLDDGDVDGAAASIARAEAIVRQTDERFFETELRRVKARVLLASGRDHDAAVELERAKDVARLQGNAALLVRAELQAGTGSSMTPLEPGE
jgi:class 3 adenylate cyclase/tetratricopeptide (TPR) repeat protein